MAIDRTYDGEHSGIDFVEMSGISAIQGDLFVIVKDNVDLTEGYNEGGMGGRTLVIMLQKSNCSDARNCNAYEQLSYKQLQQLSHGIVMWCSQCLEKRGNNNM